MVGAALRVDDVFIIVPYWRCIFKYVLWSYFRDVMTHVRVWRPTRRKTVASWPNWMPCTWPTSRSGNTMRSTAKVSFMLFLLLLMFFSSYKLFCNGCCYSSLVAVIMIFKWVPLRFFIYYHWFSNSNHYVFDDYHLVITILVITIIYI